MDQIYVTNAKEYIERYGREKDVRFRQMTAGRFRKLMGDFNCEFCIDTLGGMKDSDKVLVSLIENEYHASARIKRE